MARLITINGPLGIGKTWVVNRLKEYFGPQGIKFQDVNFQDPIKELAYKMCDAPTTMPYDLFKVTKFYGFTGREWIIQISERAKDLYPYIWVEKATNKIDQVEQIPLDCDKATGRIYIADSQGFELELDYLQEWRLRESNELVSISIEPPEKKHLRGQKWQDNDSRYNLAHRMLPDHILPDSSDAYYFLRNAIHNRGWA